MQREVENLYEITVDNVALMARMALSGSLINHEQTAACSF